MNKRLTDEIERKVNDIIVDKLGVDPDMVKPEAELVKDLQKRNDLWLKPVSWMHFKDTEECKKKGITE